MPPAAPASVMIPTANPVIRVSAGVVIKLSPPVFRLLQLGAVPSSAPDDVNEMGPSPGVASASVKSGQVKPAWALALSVSLSSVTADPNRTIINTKIDRNIA